MLSSEESGDSSFFQPVSVSPTHNRFTPHSFTHLTVWAYIAIGVIVVITSSVLCYAIYNCYQPLRNGFSIVIGETGYMQHNLSGSHEKGSSKTKNRRWLTVFFRRRNKIQHDTLSAQETGEVSSYINTRITPRPEPAHIRDVPHIRVHPPQPTSTPRTSHRTSGSSSTVVSSHPSATHSVTTATSDIWTNPKLSPVTGPVLPLARVPT